MNETKSQRVYKFRSGNSNDIDSLFENYIWFAGFSQLNDPYEGVANFNFDNIDDQLRLKYLESIFAQSPNPNKSPKEEAQERYQNSGKDFSKLLDQKAIKFFREDYEAVKNRNGVFTFSKANNNAIDFPSPLNNMLMWCHYANGFRGYCIEFDFQNLKTSIEKQNTTELAVLNVRYAHDGMLASINLKTYMEDKASNTKLSPIEILKSFSYKEQSWFYENETRLISAKIGKYNYDPSCINAIYISTNSPRWLKTSIINCIVQKQQKIGIYEVLLHDQEYKFGFKPLTL